MGATLASSASSFNRPAFFRGCVSPAQVAQHPLTNDGAVVHMSLLGACMAAPGALVGGVGPIAALGGVAAQLTADH